MSVAILKVTTNSSVDNKIRIKTAALFIEGRRHMSRNAEGSGPVTTEKWYSAMQRAVFRAVVKLR